MFRDCVGACFIFNFSFEKFCCVWNLLCQLAWRIGKFTRHYLLCDILASSLSPATDMRKKKEVKFGMKRPYIAKDRKRNGNGTYGAGAGGGAAGKEEVS